MARCREEHNFPNWVAVDYKYQTGLYVPMTEDQIKQKQNEFDNRDKKKLRWCFHKIMWIRECTKCGKEQMHYLEPYDKPDNNEKSKIKISKAFNEKKEKRYSRKMESYKDEKMSPGAMPW